MAAKLVLGGLKMTPTATPRNLQFQTLLDGSFSTLESWFTVRNTFLAQNLNFQSFLELTIQNFQEEFDIDILLSFAVLTSYNNCLSNKNHYFAHNNFSEFS